MTQLTENKIIKILKEEWTNKELQVEKALKMFMKVDSEKKNIISAETKVRHKGSQLLYTVQEVCPDEIILRTPEGKLFSVEQDEFSKEYELD